jgi:hypothetical protein
VLHSSGGGLCFVVKIKNECRNTVVRNQIFGVQRRSTDCDRGGALDKSLSLVKIRPIEKSAVTAFCKGLRGHVTAGVRNALSLVVTSPPDYALNLDFERQRNKL